MIVAIKSHETNIEIKLFIAYFATIHASVCTMRVKYIMIILIG